MNIRLELVRTRLKRIDRIIESIPISSIAINVAFYALNAFQFTHTHTKCKHKRGSICVPHAIPKRVWHMQTVNIMICSSMWRSVDLQ